VAGLDDVMVHASCMLRSARARAVAAAGQHGAQPGQIDRLLAPRRDRGDHRQILDRRRTQQADVLGVEHRRQRSSPGPDTTDVLDADELVTDRQRAGAGLPALATRGAWTGGGLLDPVGARAELEERVADALTILRSDEQVDPGRRTLRHPADRASHRADQRRQIAKTGRGPQRVTDTRPPLAEQQPQPLSRTHVQLVVHERDQLGLGRLQAHLKLPARHGRRTLQAVQRGRVAPRRPARDGLARDTQAVCELLPRNTPLDKLTDDLLRRPHTYSVTHLSRRVAWTKAADAGRSAQSGSRSAMMACGRGRALQSGRPGCAR